MIGSVSVGNVISYMILILGKRGRFLIKALILAGGYGTRLGKLTKRVPKPLMKIGNKTVIEHIVDRLRSQGITQIIVKVHYLPNKIMEVLGDKVMYYFEPVLYSHFETLENMRNWLEGEDFIVINGDTINNLDYQDMIEHHDGFITELVDEWRCAGVWIYPSTFYQDSVHLVRPYRPKMKWYDVGTPERLQQAREAFDASTS